MAEQPNQPRLTPDDIDAIAAARVHDCTLPNEIVAGAIAEFRRSRQWQDLAESTQKTWGTALNQIEAKWGDVPIRIVSDPRSEPKIIAWQESIGQTNARGADIAIMVLSRLFKWAKRKGLVQHNPTEGIEGIYKRTDRAPVIWLTEDIDAINAVSEQPLRDAIALAALTGLRRADLVTLRWREISDVGISRVAAKRSRGKRYRVNIPVMTELKILLGELRERPRQVGVETVLVNSRGKSWTGDGLASSFHDARAKANDGQGIWHVEHDPVTGEEAKIAKRLHDLRGTFATKLFTHEKNPTNREIATVMGWSEKQVDEIRKRYVDDKAIIVALANRLSG